jgi:hypothetical protein
MRSENRQGRFCLFRPHLPEIPAAQIVSRVIGAYRSFRVLIDAGITVGEDYDGAAFSCIRQPAKQNAEIEGFVVGMGMKKKGVEFEEIGCDSGLPHHRREGTYIPPGKRRV